MSMRLRHRTLLLVAAPIIGVLGVGDPASAARPVKVSGTYQTTSFTILETVERGPHCLLTAALTGRVEGDLQGVDSGIDRVHAFATCAHVAAGLPYRAIVRGERTGVGADGAVSTSRILVRLEEDGDVRGLAILSGAYRGVLHLEGTASTGGGKYEGTLVASNP